MLNNCLQRKICSPCITKSPWLKAVAHVIIWVTIHSIDLQFPAYLLLYNTAHLILKKLDVCRALQELDIALGTVLLWVATLASCSFVVIARQSSGSTTGLVRVSCAPSLAMSSTLRPFCDVLAHSLHPHFSSPALLAVVSTRTIRMSSILQRVTS
jgi:hypothetical protein